jgi:hypothetical protein
LSWLKLHRLQREVQHAIRKIDISMRTMVSSQRHADTPVAIDLDACDAELHCTKKENEASR